jgi:hypothetical protein
MLAASLTYPALLDLKRGSKLLAKHLRENPMAASGPSTLTDFAMRPLIALLVTKVTDTTFGPFKRETKSILLAFEDYLKGQFALDKNLELDDERLQEVAQKILDDEKNRFLTALKTQRRKLVKDKIRSAKAALRTTLEDQLDEQLNDMFDYARTRKQVRGSSINQIRLKSIDDNIHYVS